jgi:hypothetical protein
MIGRVRITERLCALLWLWPLVVSGTALAQQICDSSLYPLSTPMSRFEDNNDGTITDKQSNLMWLRCSAGQEWSGATCIGNAKMVTWKESEKLAQALNASGSYFFEDWRVPQIRELATIAERQCNNPRINLQLFIATPAAAYWSFTSRGDASSENSAFSLSFGPEGVRYEDKESQHYLRLVRSGP